MSGLAGVFRRDGAAVDPQHLASMTDEIAYRGRDGTDRIVRESAGLSQAMLATTPEATHEHLPAAHGGLLVTADARLDNRAELLAGLGVETDGVVTDSDLLAAAYRRWGVDCPRHLLGAFAFAIVDTSRDRLFVARDHMGIKPLYYHRSSDVFLVASDETAVVAHPAVDGTPDERRIGQYLVDIQPAYEPTFYADVTRLPNGHAAVVTADEATVTQYWRLNPDRAADYDSDRTYERLFGRLLADAVGRRLRSRDRPGVFLSGGHDSTAVACLARDLRSADDGRPLPTFSADMHTEAGTEDRYRDAVVSQEGFDATVVDGDSHDPLADAPDLVDTVGAPFLPITLLMYPRLTQAASEKTRVVLEGGGGDSITTHGFDFFRSYARAGRLLKLASEIAAFSEVMDVSARYLWLNETIKPLTPTALRRAKHRLQSPNYVRNASPIASERFCDRTGVTAQLRTSAVQRPPLSQRALHRRLLVSPSMVAGTETLNKLAAQHGVEFRYPFLDKRLVEFALALPIEQKLRDGIDRVVMRNALDGIVPAAVSERTDKASFSASYARAIREFGESTLEQSLFDGSDRLDPYVDRDAMRETHERFLENGNPADVRHLTRAVLLDAWLERRH